MDFANLWVSVTISLSATEAEHVALSTAMRDVIYFINLIDEIKKLDKVKLLDAPKPTAACRVFEDNVGALELANTHRLIPTSYNLARNILLFNCIISVNIF